MLTDANKLLTDLESHDNFFSSITGVLNLMDCIAVKSCAKVNLGLEVIGKRNNGYHEVKTILQTINFYDEIYIKKISKGIQLSCNSTALPLDEKNLIHQAACLIEKYKGNPSGICVHIKKRIPIAAGLGGGSSNAAATLIGLNRLWNLGLKKGELFNLAKELGADVPFFLSGGRALGVGRGDELFPLPQDKILYLVLVNPKFSVSTREVYQKATPFIKGNSGRIEELKEALKKGDFLIISKYLYNTLEEVVSREFPVVLEIKSQLVKAGALGSVMSGSGPTVIGIARSKTHARDIANKIENINWLVMLAEGVKGKAVTIISNNCSEFWQ